MNREIKFRGLTKREEWAYGYYWISSGRENYIKQRGEDILVLPETIGQFTGLKDKNGKEIFEGDIVEIRHDNDRGKIVWDEEESEYQIVFSSYFMSLGNKYNRPDLFVIGNIFENPNLLTSI